MAFRSDGTDTLGDFLDRIGKTALLSPTQEITLARRVQRAQSILATNPDGPYTKEEAGALRSAKRARQRLIEANLRLVVYVVKKTYLRQHHHLEMDDLIQEGIFGLNRAIDKFDPERGYKFSTYAFRWIQQGIRRAYSVKAHLIRPPAHIIERVASRAYRTQELLAKTGRTPTRQEIADALGTRVDEIELADQRLSPYRALDSTVGDGNRTLADCIPDPQEEPYAESLGIEPEAISAALATLDDRQVLAVKLHYGMDGHDPHNLTQGGKALGMSREGFRKLLDRANNRLRLALNAKHPAHQANQPLSDGRRFLTAAASSPVVPAWIGSGIGLS